MTFLILQLRKLELCSSEWQGTALCGYKATVSSTAIRLAEL